VRFWQHLEYMDSVQIYRRGTLEYRTMKLMFCEAIFYVIFLLTLTTYIVQLRSSNVFHGRKQQLNYWSGCHGDGLNACKLDLAQDLPSMTKWLRDDFTPLAFTSRTLYPSLAQATSIFRLQAGTVDWEPRYVGDTSTSILIGAIRFRQLRVQYNKDCMKSTSRNCFPRFSAGVQSRMPWRPTWTPQHLHHYFDFSKANVTEQTEMKGYHGVYPGDGFYFDLPLNLTGAQMRLRELEEWSWFDFRTRAFIIELTTLNPNVNIFVHMRILFEFPATGGITSKTEIFAFRAMALSLALMGSDDIATLSSFAGVCSCHILFFCYVCYLIKQNGLRFFTYFWSMFDIAILLVFLVLIVRYSVIFQKFGNEPSMRPEIIADPQMFFPIAKLIPDLESAGIELAVLGLISWIKILKYFTLAGMFQAIGRVIERSIYNLFMFGGLLSIVLFGFAAAFHIGYGGENDVFSTLGGSYVATLVAPTGGVDLDPLLQSNDFLGPFLLFTYIVLVLLLLLNVFMAICVDAYTVCVFEIKEVRRLMGTPHPSSIFLCTYYNALKGIKLVGKETEEEKGEPDEQIIALTSLPEAISSPYLNTWERMQAILNSAQDQLTGGARAIQDQQSSMGNGPRAAAQTEMPSIEDGPRQAAIQDRPLGETRQAAIEDKPPSETLSERGEQQQLELSNSANMREPLMVHRVQLQRMLDDDRRLRDICSTDRALDLIRRFRVDQIGVDPYQAVAQLQDDVAQKLRELSELEVNGQGLSFDELETLQTVSQELHAAITESQKEWREELLNVLQMATLLSRALMDLTKKLEQLQLNQNKLNQQS